LEDRTFSSLYQTYLKSRLKYLYEFRQVCKNSELVFVSLV
jgi:hypothetical protein